ncbi:MAG: zinc dependent phospholipase C family protein [Clostridia bacterium]|nr:zinc dependent phospholipase C family protein [Clostridia bacterium]
MKAKDHIQIAKTLSGTYALRGRRKGAFVLGNILPDINIFSYLTLSRKNHLRGHSYTFKRKKMERLMNGSRTHSTFWWLRTGMLCHYLTDSFTGSHDEKRRMSLTNHRQYEYSLHDLFSRNWRRLQIRPEENPEPVSETVARMRREYEEARAGVETDCRMIIEAVRSVIGTMAADVPEQKKA